MCPDPLLEAGGRAFADDTTNLSCIEILMLSDSITVAQYRQPDHDR